MKVTLVSKLCHKTTLPITKHESLVIPVTWLNVPEDQLEERKLSRQFEAHVDREAPELPNLLLSFTPVNGEDVIIKVFGPLIKILQRTICYGDYFQSLGLKLHIDFLRRQAIKQKGYDIENVVLMPWPGSENLGSTEKFDKETMENLTYGIANSFIGKRVEEGVHNRAFRVRLEVDMTDYVNLEDLKIPCEIKNRKILENELQTNDLFLVSATGKEYWCHTVFFRECSKPFNLRLGELKTPEQENGVGTLSRLFKWWSKGSDEEPRPWRLRCPYSDQVLEALLKFVYYNSVADAQQSKSIAEDLLALANDCTIGMDSLRLSMEDILSRDGDDEMKIRLISQDLPLVPPLGRNLEWSYEHCSYNIRSPNDETRLEPTLRKYDQLKQAIKKLSFSASPIRLNIKPAEDPVSGFRTVEFEVSGEMLWALNHLRHQQYDNNFVRISVEAYAGPDQNRKVFTIEEMKLNPDKRCGQLDNCCYVGYDPSLASRNRGEWRGRIEIWVDMSWYSPAVTPSCELKNRSLLKDTRNTDFKLISKDGKEFPCHKDIILASCNRTRIREDLLASLAENFEFHKCKYSSTAVESALKFIYYNETLAAPPTLNLMIEILEASDEYGFETLSTVACRIIQAQKVEWFDPQNTYKLLNLLISKCEEKTEVEENLINKLSLVFQHYAHELQSNPIWRSLPLYFQVYRGTMDFMRSRLWSSLFKRQ